MKNEHKSKITFFGVCNAIENKKLCGMITQSSSNLTMRSYNEEKQDWEIVYELNRDFELTLPLLDLKINVLPIINQCERNKKAAEAILDIIKESYNSKGIKFVTHGKSTKEDMLKDVVQIMGLEV